MTLSKQTGFSLVELIITLVIGSILLSWGVPAYRDFVRRQQAISLANDILGELSLARTTAIDRGVKARFEPVDSSNWSQGIRIVTDVNGNGVQDPEDEIIRQTGPLPDAFRLVSASSRGVVFNALGQAILRNNFEIILRPENVTYRKIEVHASGNVTVKEGA